MTLFTIIESIKNRLRKNRAIFLLDKGQSREDFPDEKRFDLILSPAHYWFKREKLPVKYSFQAKKYAPALFDGYLPEGEYSYQAIKGEDGLFYMFAYSDRMILQELNRIGVKPSNVGKLFFADELMKKIDKSFSIGNGYVLVRHEDEWVRLPESMAPKDCIPITAIHDALRNRSHGVTLTRYSHLIPESSFNAIAVPMLLFLVLLTTEWIMIHRQNGELARQNSQIFTKNGLPPTLFQNRAILENLKKIASSQSQIRHVVMCVRRLPLQKNEFLESFTIENGTSAEIKIALLGKQRVNAIRSAWIKNECPWRIMAPHYENGIMSALIAAKGRVK